MKPLPCDRGNNLQPSKEQPVDIVTLGSEFIKVFSLFNSRVYQSPLYILSGVLLSLNQTFAYSQVLHYVAFDLHDIGEAPLTLQ